MILVGARIVTNGLLHLGGRLLDDIVQALVREMPENCVRSVQGVKLLAGLVGQAVAILIGCIVQRTEMHTTGISQQLQKLTQQFAV